jgi:protein tyrosine phosphatase (PTP) superfamily phosphohydrolase (DUF442 family)
MTHQDTRNRRTTPWRILHSQIMDLPRGGLLLLFLVLGVAGINQPLYADGSASNNVPSSIQALQAAGITNFYRLSERFYSGSAPEGDAAFAELQRRGIKTIITVDGAKPDAETARRFGIRYVHLPIGYGGVPPAQALRLVKAAETLPGPIFVHCHHGLHRGPTGAAVICMAVEGWTPGQAESWLHLAGTSTNYPGLYRSVAEFHPPSPDVRLDNLKLIKKAGYKTPANHPDLEPAQEAVLLDELFKELLRSPVVEKRSADFKTKLAGAENAAALFQKSLSGVGVDSNNDDAFQKLNDACAVCHKSYRN